MLAPRLSTTLLLKPGDLPASRADFEVVGAFNPGAVLVTQTRRDAASTLEDEVVLLVRVAERPRERRAGFLGLPRWDARRGLVVDWVSEAEWEFVDTRVVRRRADGIVRLTFTSHLRVVWCGEGCAVRVVGESIFKPEGELEEFGVEDPRITAIDGRYYITYVAVSRHGPATALASTTDFRVFVRHGIIFCPENKDVVLFPEKIAGAYAALHRPVCGTPFTKPEMWLARSPDLLHWGNHSPLALDGAEWQSGRVGAGVPPIRVDGGWLAIYHGNRRPTIPGEVGTYYGGALLLDAADPSKILQRTAEPFFQPEADFELKGFVPNVVFPTGAVTMGDRLLIYYGAADSVTAVVEMTLEDVLCASGMENA